MQLVCSWWRNGFHSLYARPVHATVYHTWSISQISWRCSRVEEDVLPLYTHILCVCVWGRESEHSHFLVLGKHPAHVYSECVCMSASVNVGQCILLCVCMTWAQYTASISPQDSGRVCVSVCVFMCVNVLCVFHLSLVSSYLSLCVCFAPVNQSSPFTFPLGW